MSKTDGHESAFPNELLKIKTGDRKIDCEIEEKVFGHKPQWVYSDVIKKHDWHYQSGPNEMTAVIEYSRSMDAAMRAAKHIGLEVTPGMSPAEICVEAIRKARQSV